MSEFEGLRDWEQSQILSSLQRVASMMEADRLDATPILMSGPPVATAKSTVEFLAQSEQQAVRPSTRGEPQHNSD